MFCCQIFSSFWYFRFPLQCFHTYGGWGTHWYRRGGRSDPAGADDWRWAFSTGCSGRQKARKQWKESPTSGGNDGGFEPGWSRGEQRAERGGMAGKYWMTLKYRTKQSKNMLRTNKQWVTCICRCTLYLQKTDRKYMFLLIYYLLLNACFRLWHIITACDCRNCLMSDCSCMKSLIEWL